VTQDVFADERKDDDAETEPESVISAPAERADDVPAHVVDAHDRYLRELVEGLSLCPFARRSRELGRVHRPFFRIQSAEPSPMPYAQSLRDIAETHDDTEIVLLTFLVHEDHPWQRPDRFEAWLRGLRTAHERSAGPRFYLVAFHPNAEPPPDEALTPDSLVTLIRRTPDPVIQCTRARVLDRVRAQARAREPERIRRELEATFGPLDAHMKALLASSIQTDSRLSSEIAQHNFDAVGEGEGREHFERTLQSILESRRRNDHGGEDDS